MGPVTHFFFMLAKHLSQNSFVALAARKFWWESIGKSHVTALSIEHPPHVRSTKSASWLRSECRPLGPCDSSKRSLLKWFSTARERCCIGFCDYKSTIFLNIFFRDFMSSHEGSSQCADTLLTCAGCFIIPAFCLKQSIAKSLHLLPPLGA